jgi:hypothetical protein
MKLIERLSQKHLDILNESEKLYPMSIGSLKQSLSNKNSWIDLTINEGQLLIVHLLGSYYVNSFLDTLDNIFPVKKALEESK